MSGAAWTREQFTDWFASTPAARAMWNGQADVTMRREAWNDTVDLYVDDGLLAEEAREWGLPDELEEVNP